jgi:hypothetical protein
MGSHLPFVAPELTQCGMLHMSDNARTLRILSDYVRTTLCQ